MREVSKIDEELIKDELSQILKAVEEIVSLLRAHVKLQKESNKTLDYIEENTKGR